LGVPSSPRRDGDPGRAIVPRMPIICAVRVAESWNAGSIVAGVVLLVLTAVLVAYAVRVTLRR
jgi:hypothetical protein